MEDLLRVGYSLEHFMTMDSLYLAYTQWSAVNKTYADTLSQQNFLYENSQRNGNIPLKFHKTVIGHHLGKEMAHVLADLFHIEVLQTTITGVMKKYYNEHDLRF